MSKRDFLAITDLMRDEILRLFDLAGRMKAGGYRETPLAGKTLAMIFAKSSTRTRVSFEVGTYQLGGQALFLSSRDIQIGRGEPIADAARVLSRYVDGIMIRTFDHGEVEQLASHATVPVINGLTDLSHPCQVLADLFTVREALGGWEGKRIAWVGDGNNMANSWIEAAQALGFARGIACREGYEPNRRIFDRAKAAGDGKASGSPGWGTATTWRTAGSRRPRCSDSSCGWPAPRGTSRTGASSTAPRPRGRASRSRRCPRRRSGASTS